MTWHLRVKFTHRRTHSLVGLRGKVGALWHLGKALERSAGFMRLLLPFACMCVFVCVGVVQVWLMLAQDLQAHGNKQQSRQEARCNSTNF